MQSPTRLSAANAIAEPGRVLKSFLTERQLSDLSRNTHIDWLHGVLLTASPQVATLLQDIGGLAEDGHTLTQPAMSFLGRIQIDLEDTVRQSHLSDRFEIQGTVGRGSSSVALKARNKQVGRTVVLKILRPGLPRDATSAIEHLGALESIPRLVAPIDSYVIDATTSSGDSVQLYCIVFPFVLATTLDEYLRTRPPLTPFFFEVLIHQVGGVLCALEERQLSHGDLHGSNILISSEEPNLELTVIDPSPGLGISSAYGREATDFEWFKEHLATALLALQRHLPSMSIQKHLGPKLFSAINVIQHADAMSFSDVLRLLESNPLYEQWNRDRAAFVSRKFTQPKPLALLRWEEIADPAEAVELFEPYPELFRRIQSFGNSLIVGARGSGKSTYLAALAYFPGAKKRLVDPGEVFGVLFSCRQGEFKQFSKDFLSFDPASRVSLKHVLVLKIIRRLLATVSAACNLNEFSSTVDINPLYDFVRDHMSGQSSIPRVNTSPTAAMSNLAAGLVRWEEYEIQQLFATPGAHVTTSWSRLDESALLKFCMLIKSHVPALATTRFYFLFDDAGDPNIPRDTQQVLNDLVTSSNAVYCVKLSAERFSYELRDGCGRTLEETHDFTSFDIARAYATEGRLGPERTAMKEYFAKILSKRLEYWHYPSTDIVSYLGDQTEQGGTIIPVSELIRRLADRRRNAYYSGWEVVWQLADRTARNLIELVSEIFAHARVQPPRAGETRELNSLSVIGARVQDKAIRTVSERRLRGLEFIPGETMVEGRLAPIGRQLYLCASSFGSVSYTYLTSKERTGKRVDELLGIERNDTRVLKSDAQAVLQLLVRYGILDDSALTVARDDRQKKPVYIFNRIFCPACGISFRRDEHLRVSSRKLEEFLLEPAEFARTGTRFLRSTNDTKLWDADESDD